MINHTEFVSKKVAENFHEPVGKSSRILISMTTPGGLNALPYSRFCKPAVLDEASWKSILRLEFHDVDTSSSEASSEYRLFDEADAVKIIKFLKLHENDTFSAITHCEAGISRSAAVAKFIAYLYSLKFNDDYTLYNKHVFSTLMSVYGKSLYDGEPIPTGELPGIFTKELT